jgi:hypothetical protein
MTGICGKQSDDDRIVAVGCFLSCNLAESTSGLVYAKFAVAVSRTHFAPAARKREGSRLVMTQVSKRLLKFAGKRRHAKSSEASIMRMRIAWSIYILGSRHLVSLVLPAVHSCPVWKSANITDFIGGRRGCSTTQLAPLSCLAGRSGEPDVFALMNILSIMRVFATDTNMQMYSADSTTPCQHPHGSALKSYVVRSCCGPQRHYCLNRSSRSLRVS